MSAASPPDGPPTVQLLVKNPSDTPGGEAFSLAAPVTLTVAQLKAEIAAAYPGRPAVDRQRLIFSGKLLADDATLDAALAGFDVSEPQTFHLVIASPPAAAAAAPVSAADPSSSSATAAAPAAGVPSTAATAPVPASAASTPAAPGAQEAAPSAREASQGWLGPCRRAART
jgi:Ubiquitin family